MRYQSTMEPPKAESLLGGRSRAGSTASLLGPNGQTRRSRSPMSLLREPGSLPGLMLELEVSSPTSPVSVSTPMETAKPQAAENLKILADYAKSVNIVMELSLRGQEVQYINDAILEVAG